MKHSWFHFPWGKYEGVPLDEVPSSYIKRAIREAGGVGEAEKAVLREELRRRGGGGPAGDSSYSSSSEYSSSSDSSSSYRPPPPPAARPAVAVSPAVAAQIIKAGRRALAMEHHPDRGGDPEAMTAVNATADFLERQITRLIGGPA